jgi:hypothetical protein
MTMPARTPAWILVCFACACGATQSSPQTAKPEIPQLHRGPITDFVPAAGLRYMIVARPAELLTDPTLKQGAARFFSPERLDAFASQSGIDLRTLSIGCIAGFDIGTLYLAETSTGVEQAKSAFTRRLVSEPVIKHPGPGVVHVMGIIGVTPESFVGIEGRLVGVSVKDPTLTKIVGGFALEKLKKSPSALLGAALRTLPTTLTNDPLQFFAPGPFSDEWSTGAHGLLSGTIAVGITARINAPGTVDVAVVLDGDYGDDSTATMQNALVTFQDFAQSGLGHLLALQDETVTPEITATARRITLRARLPLRRLLDGLYAVVAANAWDILVGEPR